MNDTMKFLIVFRHFLIKHYLFILLYNSYDSLSDDSHFVYAKK